MFNHTRFGFHSITAELLAPHLRGAPWRYPAYLPSNELLALVSLSVREAAHAEVFQSL